MYYILIYTSETPCTFVERVKPTQPLNKFKYRPKDKKKDAPIKKKIIISKSTLSHLSIYSHFPVYLTP